MLRSLISRYPSAITDLRKALQYKQELSPEDREIMSEAHFKLSLALEFASVTATSESDGVGDQYGSATTKTVDYSLRAEAAEQLEAAIAVLRAGLQAREVELATLHNPDDNEVTRKRIAESKELIADMEQRLVDLRAPPVVLREELGLKDVLGGGVATSSLQAYNVEAEAAANQATDLSGLVRKKRKSEDDPEPEGGREGGASSEGKKAKGSQD